MKTLTILTIILFTPFLLFAQAGGEILGFLFEFAFFLIIGIAIFLILRSLMLWYWKIYDIIKNQELQIYEQKQTNYLLETQNELLKKVLENKEIQQ